MKKGIEINQDNFLPLVKGVIRALNKKTLYDLVWVAPKSFYQSKMCKEMFGENPTLIELQKAEKRENGYIKMLRGIKLYLSKKILISPQERGKRNKTR